MGRRPKCGFCAYVISTRTLSFRLLCMRSVISCDDRVWHSWQRCQGHGTRLRSASLVSTREDGGMSRFSPDMTHLLLPAIEAARDALADLDSKEVPPALRRVASYSGGRLPPPLARSLLESLDDDGWLREKAAEKLSGRDSVAAAAFLERGEGWWREIAESLADLRAASAGTAAAKAEAAADGLAEQLDVAKERLRRTGADLERARARARRKQARARPPGTDAELKKARSRLQEMESELADAVADREEAEAMIARLRARVRKESRERRRREGAESPQRSFGGGPVEMARLLDLMAAAAPHRAAAEQPAGGARSDGPAFELPPGVRPDSREAIEWLAAGEDPITVIVDGYNVLYTVDPGSFTTRRSREALAGHLARLRRSAGTARIAVVYDSNLPGDREERTLPGGVELHFSEEDRLADDEIVDLVAAARGNVVVVTSDRDLRERSEAHGAMALWSEALVDWMVPPAS